jgi:hypothetical protein
VIAAWRKHYPGHVRDIAAGPLNGDEGAQVRVHADDWVYPGCPHTGPAVAVDGCGRTHVAWYTGKPGASGIRYARAGDSAGTFEQAQFVMRDAIPTAHVAVAGLPGGSGGSVIAFDRDRAGAARLVIATVGRTGVPGRPVPLSGETGADHPAVAALDERTAIAAWTNQRDERSRLTLAAVRLPSP